VLKGRITPDMKILDAGCGEGRNLHYFIKNGYENIFGVDPNPTAIRMLQMTASSIPKEHFIEFSIEEMIFPPDVFDYVICNAVLHFAKDHQHFEEMFGKLVHVLKPNGQLFIRMTSDHAMSEAQRLEDGCYQLTDGSTRYLLRIGDLSALLAKHRLSYVEPLKSLHVHEQRTMTTLVLQKDT